MPSIGVTVFPGTNNEHETVRALNSFDNVNAEMIHHFEPSKVANMDGIYVAGGFSYGDVLRAGAVASSVDLTKEIIEFRNDGKPIIGVCNGFQILTESSLLSGVLLPNTSTRFISKFINMRISNNNTFLEDLAGETLRLPIAHFEGNYWINQSFEEVNDDMVGQYVNTDGKTTEESNPNGSVNNIASIGKSNIVGMMPHPERAVFKFNGSTDGRKIINAFLEAAKC